jgi:chromate transporter
VIAAMFRGIRPAVVALIAVPTFNLAKSAKLNRYTLWIPIVSALLIWLLGVSPIWIIIVAGIGGYLYGTFRDYGAKKSHGADGTNGANGFHGTNEEGRTGL